MFDERKRKASEAEGEKLGAVGALPIAHTASASLASNAEESTMPPAKQGLGPASSVAHTAALLADCKRVPTWAARLQNLNVVSSSGKYPREYQLLRADICHSLSLSDSFG